MARTLRALGLLLLAALACLLLAGEMSWIASSTVDSMARTLGLGGVGCLLLGLVWSVLNPVSRAIAHGRCVRCGRVIERGQTYCRDHLQATVNEYRDQTRADLR